MLFLSTDSPSKLRLQKIHPALIILFYVSLSSRQLQRLFFIKHIKNNHSSACDRCKYTKSCFKENTKIFSENSVTQENIRILTLKEDCKTYVKMETSN